MPILVPQGRVIDTERAYAQKTPVLCKNTKEYRVYQGEDVKESILVGEIRALKEYQEYLGPKEIEAH